MIVIFTLFLIVTTSGGWLCGRATLPGRGELFAPGVALTFIGSLGATWVAMT